MSLELLAEFDNALESVRDLSVGMQPALFRECQFLLRFRAIDGTCLP